MGKIFQEAVVRLGLMDKIYKSGEINYAIFLYSKGYCVIEDGYIKGVFTNDTLEGVYSETGIKVVFKNNVNPYSLVCSNYCLDYLMNSNQFEADYVFDNSFELPKELLLLCSNYDNVCINIEFISEVKDPLIQKEILQQINSSKGLL